jgi:hypothetical protein
MAMFFVLEFVPNYIALAADDANTLATKLKNLRLKVEYCSI